MAVHHVDMNVVRAGRREVAHLLAEPGEIGRQDRRRDARRLLHQNAVTGIARRGNRLDSARQPRYLPIGGRATGATSKTTRRRRVELLPNRRVGVMRAAEREVPMARRERGFRKWLAEAC